MKKGKSKGIVITAVASVLSIGMFSTLFIGANHMAFAAAANRAEPITAVTAPATITAPEESVALEGYQMPSITVYEKLHDEQQAQNKNINALTPEEAAEIGAKYIWEMLGEDIDGKIVEMVYFSFPSSTRAYWQGTVADSKAELENFDAQYQFEIDAISGERVGISRFANVNRYSEVRILPMEEVAKLIEKYSAQSDEFMPIAEEYAQRHFNNTKVENIEFTFAGSRIVGVAHITFTAVDETGREAIITIDFYERQLMNLATQHNDIVPGFNAETDGTVG